VRKGGSAVIPVTRLNKDAFLINPDKIEFIEETPDTVVSLESGRKLVVLESADALQQAIIAYRRAIYMGLPFGQERHSKAESMDL